MFLVGDFNELEDPTLRERLTPPDSLQRKRRGCAPIGRLPDSPRDRLQGNPVTLFENHREFERVDGIETQSLDEKRPIGFDLVGANVLERQRFDDEFLQLAMKWIYL